MGDQPEKTPVWVHILVSFALFGAGFGSGYYWGRKLAEPGTQPTDNFWRQLAEDIARQRTVTKRAVKLIAVTGWKFSPGKWSASPITGTVTNGSDPAFDRVELTFNLYDDAGTQVGTTTAIIRNLEAHGRSKFEVPLLPSIPDSAVEARLYRVEAF
jgi:hypothetical protein